MVPLDEGKRANGPKCGRDWVLDDTIDFQPGDFSLNPNLSPRSLSKHNQVVMLPNLNHLGTVSKG